MNRNSSWNIVKTNISKSWWRYSQTCNFC
jgi:hypothetical protein